MKRLVVLAAATLLAGSRAVPADTPTTATPPPLVDSAVLRAQAERIAVMDRAKDSVLGIFSPSGSGGGSGVVISADGYALTNFHVVKPCGDALKCGMADGELYDAVIVGVDPTGDVALIKLFGRDDFPHAELADSDHVAVGDWCFAMGNPFLLATDFWPTATYGIVSGVHRYQYPSGTLLEYCDCIQTDASINPGNSGGPLFDAAGRLIGINGRGSFEKRGRVNVGVAYAISINQIRNFLGYLHSGRIVDHATLGVQVGFDEVGRVVVENILEQSDAYRRGLRYDDEIVSLGGRRITTPNGFKNVLGIYPKGWRIPLSFRRGGQRYDAMVRLRGLHAVEELLEKAAGRPRDLPMPIPEPDKEPDPDDEPGPREPPSPDEGPHPDGSRKIDIPTPLPGQPQMRAPRTEPPMAEIVKQHFEARRGFANYYFNRLNRDRVWKAWTARGDFSAMDGLWTLAGELEGSEAFQFELADTGGRFALPGGEAKWIATDDFGASLAPPQSGGLLPALYLWRRLAVTGPEQFGDVTYLGTLPLPARQETVDALVGLYKGVECHFLFDPVEGHLLAVEVFPEEDVDPCEIYFSEYHQVDGRFLPGRMEVRLGDDLYGVFLLQQCRFKEDTGSQKEAVKEGGRESENDGGTD
ncbi:MAG: trypsin-like peptidase domain-containing protein [Pirellulales bacterium]|nr:trypsin-like peptidase domain-containing protein [Pirellulales bacterium]